MVVARAAKAHLLRMSTLSFVRASALLALVAGGAACDGSQVEELSTVAALLLGSGDPNFGPTLTFEPRGTECPNLKADDVAVTFNGAPLDKSSLGGTVLSGPLVYSCLPGQVNLPVPFPVGAPLQDDEVRFDDGIAVATFGARGLTAQRGYLLVEEGRDAVPLEQLFVITPGDSIPLRWNVEGESVSTFVASLTDSNFNTVALSREAGDSNAAPVLTVPRDTQPGDYTLSLLGEAVVDVDCEGFAACSGTLSGAQNVAVIVGEAP
jgi:hypothetical protein